MQTDPTRSAAIRPRHVLKVVGGLLAFVAGCAVWFAGAIIPADYLGGSHGGVWVLAYVVVSLLIPFVWVVAGDLAIREAKRDAE